MQHLSVGRKSMCNMGSLRTAGNSRGSIWMSDRPLEMYSAASAERGWRNITVAHILIFAV